MRFSRILATVTITTVAAVTLSATVRGVAFAQNDTKADVISAISSVGRLVTQAVSTSTDDVSAARTASINIPRDPSQGVAITTKGQTTTIALPNAAELSQGFKTSSGMVIYHNANGSDEVVVPTAKSVQFLTIVENKNAPTDYVYPIILPDNGKIAIDASGGALVIDGDGAPIATLAAPWARDADGGVVGTYFTTDGVTLTQHIVNAASASYPIVADPYVSFWGGPAAWVVSWWFGNWLTSLAGYWVGCGSIITEPCRVR